MRFLPIALIVLISISRSAYDRNHTWYRGRVGGGFILGNH